MKKQVISDILKWIEKNLNSDIRIDDIVNRSGYSRRSIQLIFKEYTGLPLGSYVRHRKLCRAAALLKLTNLSIFDISIELGFASQANFSRAFKLFFNETPNNYRQNPSWDLKKFRSIITLDNNKELIPSFCHLTESKTFGYEVSYQDLIASDSASHDASEFRFNLLKKNMISNENVLFIISNFKPSKSHHDMVAIDCIVAFEDAHIEEMLDKNHESYSYHNILGGLYVKFTYKGSWKDYSLCSRKIYTELFPKYGLSRRAGSDIEIFYYNDTILEGSNEAIIECDYYIPINE